MIDAFNIAAARPWLIQREALETILAVADRCGDPEALQTRLGRPLDNARSVTMRDGVAVVPVSGPIFRYANLFTEISGATSTEMLARDIQTALDNSYVRAIVLDLDTPGGEATGINELAELIASARSRKPIVAYVGGQAASAGYWLASAAGEVVVDGTAILGSIGVVMSYLDTTERDSKAGVRRVEIVSSQSPDKRVDPNTETGRAKVQATVDALAGVFVSAVAKFRGVDEKTVLSDFGQGGVLVGEAAVEAGMADRIGSLEAVIAELAGSASNRTRKPTMSNANKAPVAVSTTDELRSALAAGHTADQITLAAPANADAIAAARREGVAEGRSAQSNESAQAERKRILEIQAMTRPGFEAETKAAIDNGDSPESFAMAMVKASKDRGITLDAVRRDAPPAAPHASPGSGGGQPKTRSASDIFKARREAATTPTGLGR